MKKLLFIICFFIIAVNLLYTNNFWDNTRKPIISIESIISYSPSVVNYVYGNYNCGYILQNFTHLKNNNDFGFYYSDCVQWDHLFNFYPCIQIGVILNYRWLWGLQTFVLSNMYRICGFNFDIYNLSFRFSICDMGFSWFKYEWNKKIDHRNNQFCFLLSPITCSIAYRIILNKKVDLLINLGYSMQMIIDNKIVFSNTNIDASMFLEHEFNSGIGFRFYSKDVKWNL